MSTHDCETELHARFGCCYSANKSGDRFECSCGKIYEFVEDEAKGGGWELVYDPTVNPPFNYSTTPPTLERE